MTSSPNVLFITTDQHRFGTFTALLQTGRLTLPNTETGAALAEELSRFELQLNSTGAATWNAAGQAHDDLVVAAALSVLEFPAEPHAPIIATGMAKGLW